jgi:hypothetical protein
MMVMKVISHEVKSARAHVIIQMDIKVMMTKPDSKVMIQLDKVTKIQPDNKVYGELTEHL